MGRIPRCVGGVSLPGRPWFPTPDGVLPPFWGGRAFWPLAGFFQGGGPKALNRIADWRPSLTLGGPGASPSILFAFLGWGPQFKFLGGDSFLCSVFAGGSPGKDWCSGPSVAPLIQNCGGHRPTCNGSLSRVLEVGAPETGEQIFGVLHLLLLLIFPFPGLGLF